MKTDYPFCGVYFVLAMVMLSLCEKPTSIEFASPAGLQAKAISSVENELRWGPVPGAESYRIWASIYPDRFFELVDSTARTTYNHVGLKPSTKYYYQVQAKNTQGVSQLSEAVAAMTTPASPANILISGSSETLVVTWNTCAGAARYKVFRKMDAAGFDSIGDVTDTSITDRNMVAGKAYSYKISSINAGGESPLSPECRVMIGPIPKAKTILSRRIELYWDSVYGATSYEISRFVSTNNSVVQKVITTSNLICLDTGLLPLTQYSYSLKACDLNSVTVPSAKVSLSTTVDWIPLDATGLLGANGPRPILRTDHDTLYAAYADNRYGGKATVQKFDGATWKVLGSAGFSESAVNCLSFFVYKSTPYVCFNDGSAGTSVMYYDGQSWAYLGNRKFSGHDVYSTAISVDSGTAYVAYQFADYQYGQMKKYDGTSWVEFGGPRFSLGYSYSVQLQVVHGESYIAFIDESGVVGQPITVMKGNGVSWTHLGGRGFYGPLVSSPNLQICNDTPYVAFTDRDKNNQIIVMKYSGSTWEKVGTTDPSAHCGYYLDFLVKQGIPYVSYAERNYGYAAQCSVIRFTGSGWEFVGSRKFSQGPVESTSLALYGNTICIGYSAQNMSTGGVMKYGPLNP